MNKLMSIAAAIGSFFFPASISEAAERKRQPVSPSKKETELILKPKPKHKPVLYAGGRRVWYTPDSPEVKAMCKK
ncbi:hypothetical protein LC147_11940 [Vibrio harveyi]|uniref:hypothetical protein n=1 Tax=Vibrio harveyi TaxID=669 RepID=UPI003BB6DA60